MANETGVKVVAKNKKAFHDFFIEEKMEAGMVLKGTEIKSIRSGKVNLKESFATIKNGEIFIHNLHISTYEQANRFNHEPTRMRKLLLHKMEIAKLIGHTKIKGYTLVPLTIYLKNGLAKLEIGLGKGKKLYDKRHDEAKKDAQRDIERAFRDRQKM